MSRNISSIRNLGPAMESAFAAAGIFDAETLEALGADQAYTRLLDSGHSPHLITYYALVMGLQGRAWNDLTSVEKPILRARFDQIKVGAQKRQSRPSFEAALQALGVVPKP